MISLQYFFAASSSLFAAFAGSTEDFNNFYDPGYLPTFEAPPITDPDLQAAADAACNGIPSVEGRNACYFDIAVTGDVDVFAAVAAAAVEEDRTRLEVLTNSWPILEESSVSVDVFPSRTASFDVRASDPDTDPLTSALDRNDGGHFKFTDLGNGVSKLDFEGSNATGTFIAWVSVSGTFNGFWLPTFAAVTLANLFLFRCPQMILLSFCSKLLSPL